MYQFTLTSSHPAETVVQMLDGADQALDFAMAERAELTQKVFLAEHRANQNDRLIDSISRIATKLQDEVRQAQHTIAEKDEINFALATNLHKVSVEVRSVADKVERQRGALNGKDREIANLEEIILQSSRYVEQARQLLATLGIYVETADNGQPSLTINVDELQNSPIAGMTQAAPRVLTPVGPAGW